MISSVTQVALAGISRATDTAVRASSDVASLPTDRLSVSSVAEPLVEMTRAQHAHAANVAVLKSADEMARSTLSIKA